MSLFHFVDSPFQIFYFMVLLFVLVFETAHLFNQLDNRFAFCQFFQFCQSPVVWCSEIALFHPSLLLPCLWHSPLKKYLEELWYY